MIRFLIKGLLRDKQRSLLPLIVVALGVMLTVFMHAYVTGVIGDSIEFNAKFDAGHVKVVTRAYADNLSQTPLDLSIVGVDELMTSLEKEYPDITWVQRTKFSGLVDVADAEGETIAQGPAIGMAIDLLSPGTGEIDRMNLKDALERGQFPSEQGEILMSEEFSQKLGVNPGDEVTLISSTMYGSMTFYNFRVAGTVTFGARPLDKGTIIVDIEDAKVALDMYDATSEVLGFLASGYFDKEIAANLANEFNTLHSDPEDEFSPYMMSMRDQSNMATLIDISDIFAATIILVFILIMSIVLWNTGLISGLRRYGEVGVRLAIGEEKGHVYRSMINESVAVGIAGSVSGTIIGLIIAYIIQTKGINISGMMDDAAVMMPSIFRARITPTTFYIGFIPGVFSIVLGTMLSGIGIYKRETAQLFKELE